MGHSDADTHGGGGGRHLFNDALSHQKLPHDRREGMRQIFEKEGKQKLRVKDT